jgi:hypothetical protein
MPGVPVPPGFIRPDPEPDPELPSLKKSLVVSLNDGNTRQFPTIGDYVSHLVDQGIVRDLEDLISNYSQLIGEIFFQWVSTGQLGCLFAAKLAKRPRENRWLPIIQRDALREGAGLPRSLNALLDAASGTHEAAVVVFPEIRTDEEIVRLVNLLCSDEDKRWYRTDDGIDPDPSGETSLIGLRWILPSGSSVNYVLGFCALSAMPVTRHSPFTAIFLRTSETKRTPAHKEDGMVQVHLADLDSTFYPQDRHDAVWDLTKKYRANFVEPTKSFAARARITFAVSADAGKNLRDPRRVVLEKEHSVGATS